MPVIKKFVLFLYLIFSGISMLNAQGNTPADNFRKLETAPIDTNRVLLLLEIGQSYYFSKPDSKIFQPFFTTKPTGDGTGLGLSLSYDIITNAHGGALTVESKEREGAAFTIQIPLV